MNMSVQGIRRLATVLGAAAVLLAVAGCGGSVAGEPTSAMQPASTTTESAEKERETGFDECGLVEPEEFAEAIGVEAMYVISRSVMTLDSGSRRASCMYYPEDTPGMYGPSISTVANTNAEEFFEPFAKNFNNVETINGLGDRAEAVAYKANGTSRHFVEVKTISGNRGLHLLYTYLDSGGPIPKADGEAAAKILTKALERLPDEVTIPDGTPEGKCADVDLSFAEETLGAELEMARSVVADAGGMSCNYSGDDASFDILFYTDPGVARDAAVPPDGITHPDIGEGARLLFTQAETVDAQVNLGDQYMRITLYHAGDSVTEVRPADVELVRSIVDTISDGN
jgi:uncharacterized protein DUF3558